MKEPRTLLCKLLGYIEEQAKEFEPSTFQLSAVKGFLRRHGDLVGLPGVDFDINVEGDHVWLRVARQEQHRPPQLPDEGLRDLGLIRISNDPDGPAPRIVDSALAARVARATQGKSDEERSETQARWRTAVERALATYAPLWRAWASEEKPRRRAIDLYGELFATKHQIESEETAQPAELVWGMGIASRKLVFDGREFFFEYPLLTQQVEIALDEETMALEVRPRTIDPRFEADAFVACEIPRAAEVDRIARGHLASTRDKPLNPFDPDSFEDLLKLAARNLDSRGAYRPAAFGGAEDAVPGEQLVVTDAWVVFARPRTNNFLIEDLHRLKEKLESGCPIPEGPASLVTPASDELVGFEPNAFRGLSSRGEPGTTPRELYFPLPYNHEQLTIAHQLEHAHCVSVQGPPGTGKTHTIANIICHYLATGRRVLVTSRGEPALEVLQSKIPEEVRPLTVALLAGDREGIRQFRASIEAIQHQVSQLNPDIVDEEIGGDRDAIERTHAELDQLDRHMDEIAAAQLSEVQIGGRALRAEALAELVVDGLASHGWFDDDLPATGKNEPPLTDAQAMSLRDARRRLGSDIVYLQARPPAADSLPAVDEVARLHDMFVQMHEIEGEVERGALLPLKGTNPEVVAAARELLAHIEEAQGLVTQIEEAGDLWPHELRKRCRLASFAAERRALEALFDDIEALATARAELLIRPIECPAEALVSEKTREAIARGAQTGKPFGLLSFGANEAREHLAHVKIAGKAPASADDFAHLLRYAELHESMATFLVRWNQFAGDLAAPRLEGDLSALRPIEVVATTARKAHYLATVYDGAMLRKADDVFADVPATELLGTGVELASVRKHLLRHLRHVELSRAVNQLGTAIAKLAGHSGPVADALRRFLGEEIGRAGATAEQTATRYAELVAEARRVEGLSRDLGVVRDASRRLEQAGAPRFAARIRTAPVMPDADDSAFPTSWQDAWTWAQYKSHLDSIEARHELVALSSRRRELETSLARHYREMVGRAAWLATKRNATPKVLQALAGYATAIRRIGQGTGPNAIRYRRDAREAMVDAASAVPCWIMSHAKVSESMPAEIGAFDLVIVDESSQSNLWALPAILRGAKILVVGDDKQVSPDGGFISSERIQSLRQRFLDDQPYQAEMTPEKSLYDLAARVFSAHAVMLREHFRCASPIVAYSNRVFYKGGIQPLRIPTASERIDPPLVDIYVEDGERDAYDCNVREAQVITDEIAALLHDERYARRTIGVVSMLGMEQAKLIDETVRNGCDPAELLRRRFRCGDARTFQGNERDIMFLSLVSDPSACKALSGLMFEQRFNVAASRARDRMYLVRSVKAEQLSDRDLRLSLL